jgi:hypothetical protein
MPGKLKPLGVERETRSGKYPDGDGLYLIVASPTSKNWSYRYWKDGKQRWLGLGSLKDVSLKDARLARDAARLRDLSSAGRVLLNAFPATAVCRSSQDRPQSGGVFV